MPSTSAGALKLVHQGLDAGAMREIVPPGLNLRQATLHWQPSRSVQVSSLSIPVSHLRGALEILPCFCAPDTAGYQFVLEYKLQDEPGRRQAALAPVGGFPDLTRQPGCLCSDRESDATTATPASTDTPRVSADIDLLRIHAPLAHAELHLYARFSGSIGPAAPALASVSVRQDREPERAGTDGPANAPDTNAAQLQTRARQHAPTAAGGSPAAKAKKERSAVLMDVPPLSQMVLNPELAHRTCSPTCVAMLLAHYGCNMDVLDLIHQAYHVPSGLYGVWPANVQAVASYGFLGFLLHFPNWASARSLLGRGIPLVASIRFEPGELAGAPIKRSSGHLVLLCGYKADRIFINDPAAPDNASVRREYSVRDMERVWLERSAVGYVIVPQERLGFRPPV